MLWLLVSNIFLVLSILLTRGHCSTQELPKLSLPALVRETNLCS